MINISSNYKKHYRISHKLYIIAPVLCFTFIGIATFANAKENEYDNKNNRLTTEIENLKTTKDKLNKANKSLLDSSSNLDTLLGETAENNN